MAALHLKVLLGRQKKKKISLDHPFFWLLSRPVLGMEPMSSQQPSRSSCDNGQILYHQATGNSSLDRSLKKKKKNHPLSLKYLKTSPRSLLAAGLESKCVFPTRASWCPAPRPPSSSPFPSSLSHIWAVLGSVSTEQVCFGGRGCAGGWAGSSGGEK